MKKLIPLFLILLMTGWIVNSCKKDSKEAPRVTIGVLQNHMEVVKGVALAFPVNVEVSEGTVSSVLVMVDGYPYDTAISAPYEFTWTTLQETAGEHTLTAIAEDTEGGSGSHEIKIKIITSVDPVLPCPGGITISYEGQTYNTLQVGDQCWLKENMNVETANSAHYDNDPGNADNYGRLYNWDEAQTACPPGWHLPTQDDWCTLMQHVDSTSTCTTETEIGIDAGFKLKSTGGWAGDYHGSDQFGFRARAGGMRSDGSFTGLGYKAMFWSAESSSGIDAYAWSMTNQTTRALNSAISKESMLSVRCIRD